jgi:hypothetical protein
MGSAQILLDRTYVHSALKIWYDTKCGHPKPGGLNSTSHLDREAQDGDRAREDEEQPGASRIRNQGGLCEDPLHAGSLVSNDKGKEKTEHYGQTSQW